MATLITARRQRASALARLRRRLARVGRALRRWRQGRAGERALLELDDRMLRDIGLDRCDIQAAAYGVRDETLRVDIRSRVTALTVFAVLALYGCGEPAGAGAIERGRYLAMIGGCNDCHTPGYGESGGRVEEAQWLTGSHVGYSGPWGTTYAPNLRRLLASMTEDDWVELAGAIESRPPMPWFNLHAMHDDDRRAFYRFVRSLPPSDAPVPDFVPPGEAPTTPVIVFVPQLLH